MVFSSCDKPRGPKPTGYNIVRNVMIFTNRRSRMKTLRMLALVAIVLIPALCLAQATNPLWHEEKVKNYLPHMSWPEVQDLLTRTDMVVIPVASIEEHA